MNASLKVLSAAVLTGWMAVASAKIAAAATPGALQLPSFDGISSKAVQTVDISLDTSLLGMAASFMDSGKPDDAAVKEIIAGLKGVYVRSYTFNGDFQYPEADIDSVRRQLAAPGWQRLVAVHNSPDHSNVDIYICMVQGRASGLAIIASQPREFTIVNIVGSVDLQKLHQLQGKLGIPPIQLPDNKAAASK